MIGIVDFGGPMRVKLDVTKPLKRSLGVFMDEVLIVVPLLLRYEWLIDFCIHWS